MADIKSKATLGVIGDIDWVRQSLYLTGGDTLKKNVRAEEIIRSQAYSSAVLSFSDTSLGGNASMNPPAQFTENCDPQTNSLLANIDPTGSGGLGTSMGTGRYYAEAVDFQQSRVYLQFGIPVFNSLTNFFTMFYDNDQATLANTGVVADLFYSFAKYLSYIVLWEVHLVLALSSFLYRGYRAAITAPMSKFYYMRPSMPLYWSSTQNIVNAIAVNMGLSQASDTTEGKVEAGSAPSGIGGEKEDIVALHKLFPQFIRSKTGGLDIRAVASRYQTMANAQHEALAKIAGEYTSEENLIQLLEEHFKKDPGSLVDEAGKGSTREYLDQYTESSAGTGLHLGGGLADDNWVPKNNSSANVSQQRDTAVADAIKSSYINRSGETSLFEGVSKNLSDFFTFAEAERHGGSEFVSFIVEKPSGVTETFTSTTKASDIASKMNSASSQARSTMFDMAGGNIGDDLISNAVEFVGKSIRGMVDNALDSFGLSGLGALAGRAFVDMPEYWENTIMQLPSQTYTIPLRTPYGCPMGILLNIVPTLAMFLAGAAARSTGVNSYTSPYMCKLWHQGVNVIETGMITGLTVNRAVGPVGFNIHNQALAVDINVTITNMSKMMHMPISNELSLKEALRLTMFDEPNNFTNYMGTLAGLSLNDQYYMSNKIALNMAKAAENFDSAMSPSAQAMKLMGTAPGVLLKAMTGRTAAI